jgi:hypothetical protein
MRINQKIVVTAGVPIQVSKYPVLATEVFIQTTGLGQAYIMDGIPLGIIPAAKGAGPGQLTAILAAPSLATASQTLAGTTYTDKSKHGIDLSQIWIDGDTSGDGVLVSARMKFEARNA